MESILSSFRVRTTLNPEIWIDAKSRDTNSIRLDSEIRTSLLNTAKEFVDSFGVENVEIDDILFVGSLANYNWSSYSDVDLHVVIDKSLIGDDVILVNEFIDAKKNLFNLKHDIKIKGYDVEIYGQDIKEELQSSGIYSVLYNKWIKAPSKLDLELDKKAVIKKVKEFVKTLDELEKMEDSDAKINKINKLKDKIKKYRKAALKTHGELSVENLVFKYLRRSGFLETMINLKTKTKDAILSVENMNFDENADIY